MCRATTQRGGRALYGNPLLLPVQGTARQCFGNLSGVPHALRTPPGTVLPLAPGTLVNVRRETALFLYPRCRTTERAVISQSSLNSATRERGRPPRSLYRRRSEDYKFRLPSNFCPPSRFPRERSFKKFGTRCLFSINFKEQTWKLNRLKVQNLMSDVREAWVKISEVIDFAISLPLRRCETSSESQVDSFVK